MTTTATSFEPLTATIGAVVSGVDLAAGLTPDTVAAIRAALLDRKVLVFRDQHLTPASHRAFAAALGELTPAHPVCPGWTPTTPRSTCWTDLEAAYLSLSPRLRDLADQLTAVHDGHKDFED